MESHGISIAESPWSEEWISPWVKTPSITESPTKSNIYIEARPKPKPGTEPKAWTCKSSRAEKRIHHEGIKEWVIETPSPTIKCWIAKRTKRHSARTVEVINNLRLIYLT